MTVPGTTPLDDQVDDTGALRLGLKAVRASDPHAQVTMQQVQPMASALSKLLQNADREAGRATVIRSISGVAITIALGMGATALSDRTQAARNTDRIDRIEHATTELTTDRNTRAVELAGSAARIEVSIDRINEALARIDRRLDAMEVRMTSLERADGRDGRR